jgi:hypothetical protein
MIRRPLTSVGLKQADIDQMEACLQRKFKVSLPNFAVIYKMLSIYFRTLNKTKMRHLQIYECPHEVVLNDQLTHLLVLASLQPTM